MPFSRASSKGMKPICYANVADQSGQNWDRLAAKSRHLWWIMDQIPAELPRRPGVSSVSNAFRMAKDVVCGNFLRSVASRMGYFGSRRRVSPTFRQLLCDAHYRGHSRSSSPTADYYQLLVRALTGLGKSPDEAWRAAFYARARGATSGSAICWRRASLLLGLINSFEVSSMLIQQTALDGHGPGDDLRPIRIGPTD
jgi:hypothetical protein